VNSKHAEFGFITGLTFASLQKNFIALVFYVISFSMKFERKDLMSYSSKA